MNLITDCKDERLREIRFAEWPEWTSGRLYHDSLIAALSRAEAAEKERDELFVASGQLEATVKTLKEDLGRYMMIGNRQSEENASLTRDLAEARGMVCRAREVSEAFSVECHRTACHVALSIFKERMRKELSYPSPCAHAEEAKRLRALKETWEKTE